MQRVIVPIVGFSFGEPTLGDARSLEWPPTSSSIKPFLDNRLSFICFIPLSLCLLFNVQFGLAISGIFRLMSGLNSYPYTIDH